MRSVAMLLLAGCSDFNLEKVQEHLDEGVRTIAADPGLVEFGVQATNAPITETVSVTATGSLAVTIDGMEVAGASAYTITWAGEEVILEPGASTDVVVTYTPASHDDQASLTITSDATDPRVVVPLTGAGVFPAIELSPPSLSFETDALLPVDGEVRVTSVGTADLVVSAMVVEGAQFSATAQLPMTLPPGESATISVRYAPDAEGEEVTGKLWLTTNMAEGFAVVPLQGRDGPACVGLGEAWDRGLIEAYLTEGSSLAVVELSGETDVCIDHWYVWLSEASLAARVETGSYEHTIYDEAVVTYTLMVPPCEGRQALPPMETRWTDAEGGARVGTANPLVVRCL